MSVGVQRFLRRAAIILVASVGLVASSLAMGPARSQEPAGQPNILIILSDDQRAEDTMQVMTKTQRILGDNGTRFDQFFVSTPVCCPSRAALLSGRYAHNNSVLNNESAINLDQSATMENYLQQMGYTTSMAGKFLNGWPIAQEAPPFFDRWASTHGGYWETKFNVNGYMQKVRQYSVDFIEHQVIRDLQHFERADDRPWFLYVTPAPPHSPSLPEPKYARTSVGAWEPSPAVNEIDRSDKPPYVQKHHMTEEKANAIRTKQLRTLRSLDDMVAGIYGAMSDLGETQDTLIIFLSDNGYLWGEHGLRGKRVPYTPSIRVPLYMRWDNHIAPGAVDDRLRSMVDVLPTVLEAAGVDSGDLPTDGRSLLTPGGRERLLIEHWTEGNIRLSNYASTRTSAFQYTEYYDLNGLVVYREYYDLTKDPWQLDNLLGDSDLTNDPDPLTLQLMADQLNKDRSCEGDTCP
jgi:arylsulfatase A-like enzyme